MLPFSLQFILVLVIVSGAIAFIGDWVGRFFGRKRLTIFSLRPRYTAVLITIISGILIAAVTLGTIVLISQDARTALFGLEKLRAEVQENQKELLESKLELERAKSELSAKVDELEEIRGSLKSSKQEIKNLQKTKAKLRSEVEIARSGAILFKAGEVVYVTLLKAGRPIENIKAEMRAILDSLDGYLKEYKVKDIEVSRPNFEEVAASIAASSKDSILRILATQNVTMGQNLPVLLESIENRRIFKNKEMINLKEIDGSISQALIEQELKEMLEEARAIAAEKGVLPDSTGSIGSISYSEIFDTAKDIKKTGKKATVEILALKDIYAIGPLEIEFWVEK